MMATSFQDPYAARIARVHTELTALLRVNDAETLIENSIVPALRAILDLKPQDMLPGEDPEMHAAAMDGFWSCHAATVKILADQLITARHA